MGHCEIVKNIGVGCKEITSKGCCGSMECIASILRNSVDYSAHRIAIFGIKCPCNDFNFLDDFVFHCDRSVQIIRLLNSDSIDKIGYFFVSPSSKVVSHNASLQAHYLVEVLNRERLYLIRGYIAYWTCLIAFLLNTLDCYDDILFLNDTFFHFEVCNSCSIDRDDKVWGHHRFIPNHTCAYSVCARRNINDRILTIDICDISHTCPFDSNI